MTGVISWFFHRIEYSWGSCVEAPLVCQLLRLLHLVIAWQPVASQGPCVCAKCRREWGLSVLHLLGSSFFSRRPQKPRVAHENAKLRLIFLIMQVCCAQKKQCSQTQKVQGHWSQWYLGQIRRFSWGFEDPWNFPGEPEDFESMCCTWKHFNIMP